MTHAGSRERFAAFLLDAILLSVVEFILILSGLAALGSGVAGSVLSEGPAIVAYLLAMVLSIVAGRISSALLESSPRGATLDKIALNIRVNDLNGSRISFGRTTGRYFAKMLSSLILMVGSIMAGCTDRKRALHDINAGCLVVNA